MAPYNETNGSIKKKQINHKYLALAKSLVSSYYVEAG